MDNPDSNVVHFHSVLQPLNNIGSSSQEQEQAAVGNYQNENMYTVGAIRNGKFDGYDEKVDLALHFCHRKRSANLSAGMTTVTKSPPKKKRTTMPDDAYFSSTVTTTEQSLPCNTKSMGSLPLVTRVQSPVEPNLKNNPNSVHSSNIYNRTAGVLLPYNILVGDDDLVDEQELRRKEQEELRKKEASRMILDVNNELAELRDTTTINMLINSPRGPLIDPDNDPFMGVNHVLANDSPLFGYHQRPRRSFIFGDDDDFDVDMEAINLGRF